MHFTIHYVVTDVFGKYVDVTLEKEMATHSTVLAWRIPWTEEPGRLQTHRVTKHQILLNFISVTQI